MIYSIDGNIGSGKSTAVRALKESLKYNSTFIFLEEPVDDWNNVKSKDGETILEKFYANQEKYSFSFQMMAYISRLALLRKTIRENPGCHIVTERSIYTDKNVFAKMLYDDGKIEEVEYQIYLKWFDEFIEEVKVDYVIYIKATAEKCFERIKKRNRSGESEIPLDYLIKCGQYHDDWIIPENNLVIDNNNDITSQKEHDIINKTIIDFMYQKIDEKDERDFDNEIETIMGDLINNVVKTQVKTHVIDN